MSLCNDFFFRPVRAPLLHFLVLGAGLFLLYAYVGESSPEPANLVVVDEAEIQRFVQPFQRTWTRPPSRGGGRR